MIFSRAWFALMRRNVVYRRRNVLGCILEIFLPMSFVGILVSIKNAVNRGNSGGLLANGVPAIYPTDNFTWSTFTFSDYVTALQTKKVCLYQPDPRFNGPNQTDSNPFSISGMVLHSLSWPVPFVRCNSFRCEYDGQDALPFCEFGMMGLAPKDEADTGGAARALDFQKWLYNQYPILLNKKGLPFHFDFVKIFKSSKQMSDYVQGNQYGTTQNPKLMMGIVWEGNDTHKYRYQLRQNSTNFNRPERSVKGSYLTTPDTARKFMNYARNDFEVCTANLASKMGEKKDSCTGQYMYNGVLVFERLVGDYILNRTGAAEKITVEESGVKYVQFPQKPFMLGGFYDTIRETGPLLVTLGLLYPTASMVGFITREKELRQKELMKMMSVTESDIGWAWFVSFFLFNIISILLTTLMSTKLYVSSAPIYLLEFWFFAFLATTVFSMFTATLTSKASRGILIGLLVLFTGVFMTIAIPLDYRTDKGTWTALISLHPVAAYSYALQEIGRLEDQGTGLQSNTIAYTDNPSGYTFTDSIRYLFFDCIFWGAMTFYLNRVIPPDYGQAQPLWFPFLPSFWFPSYNPAHTFDPRILDDPVNENIPVEPVSKALKRQAEDGKSIEVRGLRKVFGDNIAVDGLNLSMYNGQITALLGHNGAGKTTTIGMLTGALAPTEGIAMVAGKDIRTQMSLIRQDIGICLQHDCLFPLLTVREHIQFFSRLKGLYSKVSRMEAEEHIDQAIRDVALFEKRDTLSKNLSGGMKRKLSVAIAFCGGSEVVLLDEPTSGMDPFSRRFTWNVIRQYRQGRCIILTTHFMDEADILGDRIAIMAEGQLQCAGSALFLKRTYGVGYQLTIEKCKIGQRGYGVSDGSDGFDKHDQVPDDIMPSYSDFEDEIPEGGIGSKALSKDLQPNSSGLEVIGMESASANSPDAPLIAIVKGSVADASLLSNVGSEMTFQLPMGASSQFKSMFDGLDREIEEKRIISYGVSITTLDEVFLLVARGCTPDKRGSSSSQLIERKRTSTESTERTSSTRMDLEKDGLFFRHLGALLLKRAAFFRRDKKAWMCTTVLPSLFVCFGFIIFTFAAPTRNLDPLVMTLNDYNPEISSSPKNPIKFNQPNGKFGCQPGNCVHLQPVVNVSLTQETYYYCGTRGELAEDYDCSVDESANIMRWLNDSGASPEPVDASDISQVSLDLYYDMEKYAATQYGAITFLHDTSSFISDGNNTMYRDKVREACLSRRDNYTSEAVCNKYGGVGYVIHYNFTALHVAPLYQALADEALVREGTGDPDYEIELTIAPLPVTNIEAGLGASEDAFAAWFLVVLSFPFIAGAFASFVVAERHSKAKHLQTVAGVDPFAYWLSTFTWDVLNYQIPLWATIMLMWAFDVKVLTTFNRDVFSGILAVLVLYGPASASFTYCISQAFDSASLCNMFVIIFGFLIGMGGTLTCFILKLLAKDPVSPRPNLFHVAEIVAWCLRFIPSFCLANGVFNAINIDVYVFLTGNPELNAWSEPVLLYEVIFLAVESVAYLLLVTQIDKWSTNPRALSIWQRFISFVTLQWLVKGGHKQTIAYSMVLPDDDDVLAEQDRVLSGSAHADLIVISQLSKMYDNGKLAVDNLSLGIPPGECFGLLGINGAGKTTTMGMLTAEFPPTSGDATLAGFSVSREPEKTRRRIGYCPQFDAHFSNLTGREHVELYASIKGVPKRFIKEAALAKLREVGLNDSDIDRLSSGYSGGMKRRLSLACATIGQPQIVFLDECSTGVDPVARREIWQLINEMVMGGNVPREERTSVILTTHSMEECEALCPRIGIMAAGRLRCLGSAQQLKNKFGQGYQVELKVMNADREDEDYLACRASLLNLKGFDSSARDEEAASLDTSDVFLDLEETLIGLKTLSGGDDRLWTMVREDNSIGYAIWKDASSEIGVPLDDVAAFAVSELRMLGLEEFLTEYYPNFVLRERQDSKARYEIPSAGIRISSIFARIEENKERLRLADYGVSQTSLEQVFNMHAAEAERLKQSCNDG